MLITILPRSEHLKSDSFFLRCQWPGDSSDSVKLYAFPIGGYRSDCWQPENNGRTKIVSEILEYFLQSYIDNTLSILVTVAPKSDKIIPHNGDGASPVNSRIFIPFNAILIELFN